MTLVGGKESTVFTPDPLGHLRAGLGALDAVVGGLEPSDRAMTTPCAGWSVDDLLGHLRDGTWWVVARLDGAFPGEETTAAPSLHAAGEALADAFGREGVLDDVVRLPAGEVPGLIALHLRAVEAIVHAWDLAAATGGTVPADDAEVEVALAFSVPALEMLPPESSPFAPSVAVADHAPALDRLVGLLGRDPAAWPVGPVEDQPRAPASRRAAMRSAS